MDLINIFFLIACEKRTFKIHVQHGAQTLHRRLPVQKCCLSFSSCNIIVQSVSITVLAYEEIQYFHAAQTTLIT